MTAVCPGCVAVPLPEDLIPKPQLQFSLPGIHCAACIGKIEAGLRQLPDVSNVRVNLSLKRVSLDGDVAAAIVVAALNALGFDGYPLEIAALEHARDDAGRALLTRTAVAGFAMMNVMLLSVAVWSGAPDATRDLFHLISAAITLPVIAYAGQPFFRNAWTALRVGRLNMDVPISLAITLAAAMSLFETLNGGTHAYFDAALSLTFFLLIGRYMDHRARSAARSAAKELNALEVQTATLVTDGMTTSVKANTLAIGDMILVPTGARVPVDGMLSSQDALMDRSLLTGESEAVALSKGAILQAGEINVAAPFHLRATAVGADTSLHQMAKLVELAENGRNSYTALADRAAAIYAPAVHLLALLAFAGWVIATGDVRHALNVAIAVLIITCPCALGLAVPAVSIAAISRLFALGCLVKHATALERLSEITHIVFDKTGTLSRPSVSLPDDFGQQYRSVAKSLAQASHHPLSRALDAELSDVAPANVTQISEIAGQGVTGIFHGQTVRLGRGAWLDAPFDGLGLQIGKDAAKRVLAQEGIRDGVRFALEQIDLPCEIVTGDAKEPAQKFAERLSLPVTWGARPADKLNRLQALAAQGDKVLMVGDGLNDTAALAAAHASIAPATALDASRSAADVVILKNSFADLALILRVAKAAGRLSKQNFAIAALYNAIAIPIAVAGFATPLAAALAMSASSVTVLANSQRMRFIK